MIPVLMGDDSKGVDGNNGRQVAAEALGMEDNDIIFVVGAGR